MRPSEILIKENPPAAAAYNQGLEKAKRGAWEAAAAALEQALAADPRHVKAHTVLGKVYLRQGHLARAQACWRQVLRIEPENRSARQCLQALEGHRTRAAAPVTAADLFRVAALGWGIMALLLLYNILQDVRQTQRAITEQFHVLQNEIQTLRPMAPEPAPPVVPAPAAETLTSPPPAPAAEKGPLP